MDIFNTQGGGGGGGKSPRVFSFFSEPLGGGISSKKNLKAQFFQSNAEHEIVNKIQSSIDQNFDFIILNPAAFTHSSIAMRDALLAVKIPFIEVHLSNIYAREDFRKKSYFSDIAAGVIAGFGFRGYFLAVDYISDHLKERR